MDKKINARVRVTPYSRAGVVASTARGAKRNETKRTGMFGLSRATGLSPAVGRATGDARGSRTTTRVAETPKRLRSDRSSPLLASSNETTVKTTRSVRTRAVDPAFVDAFGITGAEWEQIEGGLFGASLAPYLGFLYFLSKEETKCPRGTLFGFKFLLAFVFGTIPFAIVAKVQYDEILANVDVLHGVAESLLTMTNVFIVLGFREGLREASQGNGGDGPKKTTSLGDIGAALFCALVASNAVLGASDAMASSEVVAAWDSAWPHVEPSNALSLPTWVIHVSSLVEWLIAMGLAWEYAEVTNRPAWKGLTWGMVPCHASGIAACTFHLFYNSPALNSVVAMQAFLTVVGNTTCAIAAYRISKEGERLNALPTAEHVAEPAEDAEPQVVDISLGTESLKGWEDLSAAWASDSDAVLLAKLALVSVVASAAVKYGSLLVDFPFEPSIALAFSIIFIPTLLNCAKWNQLSQESATN